MKTEVESEKLQQQILFFFLSVLAKLKIIAFLSGVY